MRRPQPRSCPIAETLDLVGERWSLLVLREMFMGVHRFGDIAANTGAPLDVLTKRLRSLEAAGVLERRAYHQRPVRFEYHFTPAGRDLEPVLIGLREWGLRHLPEPPPSPRILHTCGAEVETMVVCATCGDPLASRLTVDETQQAEQPFDTSPPAGAKVSEQ